LGVQEPHDAALEGAQESPDTGEKSSHGTSGGAVGERTGDRRWEPYPPGRAGTATGRGVPWGPHGGRGWPGRPPSLIGRYGLALRSCPQDITLDWSMHSDARCPQEFRSPHHVPRKVS